MACENILEVPALHNDQVLCLFLPKPAFKTCITAHTYSHTAEACSKVFLDEVVENQEHL